MRNRLIVLLFLCCAVVPAVAQVSFSVGVPGLSIGVNVPVYPQLVRVPGYPVYYAPGLNSNYFFYDGMYWVYQGDNWYASSWYNGPWSMVGPQYVPAYVLRVPVRYYRAPPQYFRGWPVNASPRWGQYWGPEWSQRRTGWDQWNRHAAPPPAPIPYYQQRYSGNRYPQGNDQQVIHNQNYRYQPKDPDARQHYPQQGGQPHGQYGTPGAPNQRGTEGAPSQPQRQPQALPGGAVPNAQR